MVAATDYWPASYEMIFMIILKNVDPEVGMFVYIEFLLHPYFSSTTELQ